MTGFHWRAEQLNVERLTDESTIGGTHTLSDCIGLDGALRTLVDDRQRRHKTRGVARATATATATCQRMYPD